MWEKCVSCGEGLFAGDAFCGNCGRPTTSTVPTAREPASGPFARPDIGPEPTRPDPAGEPDGPPQLELGLGLGLVPGLGEPAGPGRDTAGLAGPGRPAGTSQETAGHPAPDGPAEPGTAAGMTELTAGTVMAGPGDGTGMARQGGRAAAGDGPPEPEMLIIPARQVGGPAGPGGRLTVPAQRRGQPSQPDRPAGSAGRPPHRTRLTGQANLDPAANSRFLLRVMRQAALFAGLYALTETVLLIVFLVLGFTTLGLHNALRLETDSLWLVALALASLFWVIPVPALLGQWSVLVESSAEASDLAFEHIATAFREHDAPFVSLDIRAVSPPHEDGRDYLELRRGRFSGFISCFPHGRDLYVGWTFFLRMSPARLVLVCAGRSAAHLTRRGGDIRRALWFESARALVAAMHSATLAGIGAVVSAPDAPGESAGRADDVVVKFG